MSVLALVSMTPLDKGESVSRYVAKVVDLIDKAGKPHLVTPMGTIIEGETWNDVMDVLKEGFESLAKDCRRISIMIKIDYRQGKSGRITSKIKSLEEKLGRDLPS